MSRSRLLALSLSLLAALPSRADEKPLRQIIDAEVKAAWQREKITPAGKSDDATFLRRVYLDLLGTVPSYDDTIAFAEDSSSGKREALIDKLLADPRFARAQADVWDLAFFGRKPGGSDLLHRREPFKKWLADKFEKNVPYDQWVRDLLLAEEEGSQTYLAQFRGTPEEATVQVSRMFLGTQLQCARCHDHPFDKWTQKDFFGMAGFFVRVVVSEGGSGANRKFLVGEKNFGEVLFTGPVKDQKPGQKGEPVKPKFLGGEELKEPPAPKDAKNVQPKEGEKLPQPAFSRKEKIAAWVTASENPYFATAVANRVWAQFLGRGLVHPVDDLGEKNRPSHPELLQALADGLKAHKFDLKWFIRELVNSETYQQAATGPAKDALPKWYERARVRPLSAEELMAAFRQATMYDAGDPATRTKPLNTGEEYFRIYFGEPTDGLGEFQGSISEHLFLNNGHVWQIIRRKKGNLAETLIASKEPTEQKVERLFLTVLSRKPKDAERAKFVQFLEADKKSEGLVEEAIWVLLNSAEFRFNH
jgi:hypothetical protein